MTREPDVLRLARASFEATVRRDASGTPFVSPEFVAEQGQYVRIVDVRERDELEGPLGHIPAVTSVPMAVLAHIPDVLERTTLLVVVSGTGQRAAVAARYLEALGMDHVAAMEGGMTAWKRLGFSAPRDLGTTRLELRVLPPGTSRSGKPLAPVVPGMKLTEAQILDHLGDPGAVRWVKLAAFLLHGKRSCVDGRDDKGVIGTPGGDAGELMLALAAAEAVRGAPLSDDDVERLLMAHLDAFGRFYMHSDTDAMDRLVAAIEQDPQLAPALRAAGSVRAFLAHPPEPLRAALLEHLTDPAYMGCGHLRLVLTDPAHDVRPGLSRAVLRAFHRARWAGAPDLEWVVLGGEHVEGAVIAVTVDAPFHSYTRIPLVSPQVDGLQMFVSHPQVTAHIRRETASFLTEAGAVPADAEEALLSEVTARGERQLNHTLSHLAQGLPVYRIAYPPDPRSAPPTVTQVGTVG
ncbi:MAG: rhodanese-like domain-containing protein [Myxococcota bacterium]